MKKILSALFISLLMYSQSFAESDARTEHAAISLSSAVSHFTPGQTFLMRLHFELAEDWHIYWQNPGDSGLAVSLGWTLPEGFTAGDIQWPAPEQILIEGLMNYGYHDHAALLVPITAPQNIELDENFPLAVKANWLICKETCIPESAELAIELTSAEAPVASDAADKIKEAAQEMPLPYPSQGKLSIDEKNIILSLPVDETGDAYFYPSLQGAIDHAAPQEWKSRNGILTATLKRGTEKFDDTLSGILQLGDKHFQVSFSKNPESGIRNAEPAVETKPSTINHQPQTSIFAALFFAFLGGLLLNAMPCVFPVLSLKALAISKKAEKESAAIRAQGIAYLLGCIATFSLLAVALMVLKQAGHASGWGFQLQTPAFVAAMLCLFLIIGLGLAGLFEFPQLIGNLGQEKAAKDSTSGSFFTGVLAVLVATPCTVPFMAPALSFAFTQSPPMTVMVMVMMGLGMAVPYLLISFVPPARKLLPKPGAWMERFKQLMAFPMFGTAAWLLWVLVQQVSLTSLALVLLLIVFIPFMLWLMKGKSRNASLTISVLTLVMAAYVMCQLQPQQMVLAMPEEHIAYDAKELARLRDKNTPVFLDATAAWCITCKVNENGVLRNKSVQHAFKEKGIVMMVADWTNYDPAITKLLESFDHQGVPLYVYYPPANDTPRVLPQLLTQQSVLDTINN